MHELILSTSKMCIGKKNCFLYFLIIALYGKWIKPNFNYSVESFNISIRCRLQSSISLFMACQKDIIHT